MRRASRAAPALAAGAALAASVGALLILSACSGAAPMGEGAAPPAVDPSAPATAPAHDGPGPTASPRATALPTSTASPTPRPTVTPIPATPTPDPPRPNVADLSPLGEGWAAFSYKLQPGEDLGQIAGRYGLSYDQIRVANGLTGGETVFPGQVVLVPQKIKRTSPAFKIIPDSELVYGPSTVGFDTLSFVARYRQGFLYDYAEMVDGQPVSGAALIQRGAESHSLNPRLLLALLEYQSGWLTQPEPAQTTYPFGRAAGGTEGLFRQIQWTASALNSGFYQWRDGSLSLLILGDGTRVGLAEGLNAGTAALQHFFSLARRAEDWESAVTADGFASTYRDLFGDPFAGAVDPLLSPRLTQPELSLPWQGGETWFFSGGPHASFGPGTPWGAVDFLPPGRDAGCEVSENWVTAIAPGVVARSGNGQLLLDLDGDGHEQTGWVILYLHLSDDGRPPAGTVLVRGDKVGHASCEGGFAKDAHIHLARKVDGVWLPAAGADGLPPFVLGGLVVHSSGLEYNGTLRSDELVKTACACRTVTNAVTK